MGTDDGMQYNAIKKKHDWAIIYRVNTTKSLKGKRVGAAT